MRLILFIVVGCSLLSCKINHYVLKSRQIDLLPLVIQKDSIVFLPPAFSMHNIDDRFRVQRPIISFGKTDSFRLILNRKLSTHNLKIDTSIQTGCLTNKLTSNNWRDSVWYTSKPYRCVKLKPDVYNVLIYSQMDIRDGVKYNAAPDPGSLIQSLLIVFKDNQIVYTRQYYSIIGVDNDLYDKIVEDTKYAPFFPNHQIELVLNKVTEDLFKRIR
jgi:hypothetical protein